MTRRGNGTFWMMAVLAATVVVGQAQAAPQSVEAAGKIEAVTVYRGQAMVSRVVQADLPAGMVEVVVPDLPAQVIGDSMFADADGKVAVQAVRYRTRAVQESPRPEVKELDQAVEALNKQLREMAARQQLLTSQFNYINNLESFSAAKAKDDLNTGKLDAEALVKLSQYIFETRQKLSTDSLALSEQMRETQQKLELVQRQRAELMAGSSRTVREAIVFVNNPAAGAVTLRVNYMVQGAGWAPLYNLRGTTGADKVAVEYNAIVQQTSGEDWSNVKLTLSTARPAMTAEAPLLTPLWVTLTNGAIGWQPQSGQDNGMNELRQQAKSQVAQELLNRRISGTKGDQVDNEWGANISAGRMQLAEFNIRADELLTLRQQVSDDDVLSVSYALVSPISVPSRSDQQMIRVASLQLGGEFYYKAIPLLTSFVYREAEVINTSDVALLDGPVNSYMDGQFVGVGRVGMVAQGQSFTVGLGVDSQLRARRELVDKSDTVQGGNKVLGFEYRIVLDNYKEKPVTVRVFDRLPEPENADIRVELVSSDPKISEDKLYQATLRKKNLLRWDVEVPAGARGLTAKAVDYKFTVAFDKNLNLAEPATEMLQKNKEVFKQELHMMQSK